MAEHYTPYIYDQSFFLLAVGKAFYNLISVYRLGKHIDPVDGYKADEIGLFLI